MLGLTALYKAVHRNEFIPVRRSTNLSKHTVLSYDHYIITLLHHIIVFILALKM